MLPFCVALPPVPVIHQLGRNESKEATSAPRWPPCLLAARFHPAPTIAALSKVYLLATWAESSYGSTYHRHQFQQVAKLHVNTSTWAPSWGTATRSHPGSLAHNFQILTRAWSTPFYALQSTEVSCMNPMNHQGRNQPQHLVSSPASSSCSRLSKAFRRKSESKWKASRSNGSKVSIVAARRAIIQPLKQTTP